VTAPPGFVRAERLAQQFHEAYERLAPQFGYQTREASAKPWADVPEPNRSLMIAVAAEVFEAAAPAIRQAAVNDERGRLQGHLADAHARAAGLEAQIRELLTLYREVIRDDIPPGVAEDLARFEETLEGKS
jgi:hypothetical protein